MKICIELIQAIREIRGVAGMHIMAPRQDHLIPALVRESGVLDGRRPAQVFATSRNTVTADPV
jgi:methylenetetrahydrofolate reductase (NADPH)